MIDMECFTKYDSHILTRIQNPIKSTKMPYIVKYLTIIPLCDNTFTVLCAYELQKYSSKKLLPEQRLGLFFPYLLRDKLYEGLSRLSPPVVVFFTHTAIVSGGILCIILTAILHFDKLAYFRTQRGYIDKICRNNQGIFHISVLNSINVASYLKAFKHDCPYIEEFVLNI